MMYECQNQPNTIGVHSWPTEYRYGGFDRRHGLHRFIDSDGRAELFARRKSAPAGWHIVRGAYCFEFCRGE